MYPMIIFIVCSLLGGMPSNATALTVEEILLLKQKGVSEQTIQMMLESEMRAQSLHEPASQERMGVTTIPRPAGRKAIVYTTGQPDPDARDAERRLQEQRAWEMLRHLIVGTRSSDD